MHGGVTIIKTEGGDIVYIEMGYPIAVAKIYIDMLCAATIVMLCQYCIVKNVSKWAGGIDYALGYTLP